MRFYEYGKENAPKIMLIHGGGNSKWMFEKVAELLGDTYRVILPELDGHGEEYKNTYISTKEEAEKIVAYLEDKCNGSLYAIAGVSLGAQIAMEVLAKKPRQIKKAYIESGICLPKPALAKMMSWKWMIKLMIKAYDWKWMVRLSCKSYGWSVAFADRIAEDAKRLSIESNLNLYQTYLHYDMPESLHDTTADVLLSYGSKEKGIMKKDVSFAHTFIKASRMEELKGYNHCGMILSDPDTYSSRLREFLNNRR